MSVSRGRLCRKCATVYNGVLLDPRARLLTPLRRDGPKGSGRFRAVSWDEALAEISGRLAEVVEDTGAHTILAAHHSRMASGHGYKFKICSLNCAPSATRTATYCLGDRFASVRCLRLPSSGRTLLVHQYPWLTAAPRLFWHARGTAVMVELPARCPRRVPSIVTRDPAVRAVYECTFELSRARPRLLEPSDP